VKEVNHVHESGVANNKSIKCGAVQINRKTEVGYEGMKKTGWIVFDLCSHLFEVAASGSKTLNDCHPPSLSMIMWYLIT
jgi:hypothetical protein